MKVWQKVYLATLAIFLAMLNIGLILASNYIFEYNVAFEKEQCERECYFLKQNLEHDFSYLEKNGRMHIAIMQTVVENYQNYYQNQNLYMELRETDATSPKTRSMVIRGGKEIFIQVERPLSAPYAEYAVFYQKELVDFEETWSKMQVTFVLISISLSLLLGILLFFMMQKFFKPLENLNLSVAAISQGDYDQNIKYFGEDEVAELSENINLMADTIQQQITKLEEENSKKQQLMDNLAHELRTPLTSIYGYAELLQMGKITEEELFEGLSYIMRESKRLNKMSEEMLSMRLFEREGVHYVGLCMNILSEHIRKILEESLNKKNIILKENHQIDSFWGEEYLYIVLFRNLLENAIRASYEGGTIEWESAYQNNTYLFRVQDYGIGMNEEEISRIMDAFYRVDKGRSRAEGGAGLGLSIVDIIVKKLNGTIEFESKKNEGTKVTVVIQVPEHLDKEL